MIGAMHSALLGVGNIDKALHLFRDVIELQVERDWTAPGDLVAAWMLDPDTQVRLVELSCKGYPVGRLRLAYCTPAPRQLVRLDHGPHAVDSPQDVGPKAIDFYVADPIETTFDALKDAGYEPRSQPVKHRIGDTISEEVLFTGPDGLPILLMVGHRHASTSMRLKTPDGPFSEVATISIVAGDVAETRRFYGEMLGMHAILDAETPDEYRELVNDLTGTPKGTRIHFLMYTGDNEPSGKILLVHFFDATGKRLVGRMRPGHLGFSLLSHETDEMDALHGRLDENVVVTPPTSIVDPEGDYRVMLVRGPNEEMFEFFERG